MEDCSFPWPGVIFETDIQRHPYRLKELTLLKL